MQRWINPIWPIGAGLWRGTPCNRRGGCCRQGVGADGQLGTTDRPAHRAFRRSRRGLHGVPRQSPAPIGQIGLIHRCITQLASIPSIVSAKAEARCLGAIARQNKRRFLLFARTILQKADAFRRMLLWHFPAKCRRKMLHLGLVILRVSDHRLAPTFTEYALGLCTVILTGWVGGQISSGRFLGSTRTSILRGVLAAF